MVSLPAFLGGCCALGRVDGHHLHADHHAEPQLAAFPFCPFIAKSEGGSRRRPHPLPVGGGGNAAGIQVNAVHLLSDVCLLSYVLSGSLKD